MNDSRTRPFLRTALVFAAIAGAFAFAIFAAGPIHQAFVGKAWAFARTFRYLLLVSLVAVFLVSAKPWRDAPPDFYGLRGPRSRPWCLLVGAALSFAILLADVLGQAAAGSITWDTTDGASKFWQRLAPTAAAAVGLGVVEEVFFRGWLFARMSRGRGAFAAAAWTALLFALPPAFQGSKAGRDLSPDVSGAMDAMSAWGGYIADPRGFLPKFVGLLGLSMVLTTAYRRFGTLWICVGIHGGAHLFMQLCAALTKRDPETWNWAGSKWLYDGVPAWGLMALLAWGLWPKKAAGGATLD